MNNTPPPRTCSVPDCTKKPHAKGLCSMHLARLTRHGSVDIRLRQPPQVNVSEKRCPRCSQTKPIGEFGKRPNGKPKGYCNGCMSGYDQSYAASSEGREARRSARATWNTDNHEYFLQYRYGIGRVDYDRMVAEQDGKCAICRTDAPGSRNKVWPVDHCHETNKVRGLLCHRCNMALGYFKDDPVRIAAALAYLAK